MTDDAEVIEGEQVEEIVEEVETETAETETSEPSEPSPEKETDGFQKRIDKATRKQRDAERDRDYWREQATIKPEPVAEKPPELEVKTLEDFEYDEGKYQAYIFETARTQAQEDRANTDTQARQKAFEAKEEKYSKVMPDYMEVTRDTSVTLTKEMVEIASSSDKGPELLYHLAKNPDISASIARLSLLDAAREMGRIEATKLVKGTKSTSKAPPPAKVLKGGDPVIKKDPGDMTQKEFNEYRRKVISKR